MEGRIYNATVVHGNQKGVARSVSRGRKSRNQESKISKMDTVEFLWTVGGAAVAGTGIYLLSFVMI